MPDGFRVRTYFLSLSRRYAEVGARHGEPGAVRTALALLEVLLCERADDGAALQLRAELRAQLGNEQNALDASAELARLSLGKVRRPVEPRTPQGDAAGASTPWLPGTPAASAAASTPATAHAARGAFGLSSARQPVSAPPWHAHTPRQPAAPAPMPRLAGFAPVAALGDALARTPASTRAHASPRLHQPGAGVGGDAETPPSAARGVLGRQSGAGSSSRKGPLVGSAPRARAGPASTLHAASSPGLFAPAGADGETPRPRAPAAATSHAKNAVASRARLEQEIRQWRRQLVRAQLAGRQFADRSGDDAEWAFNYLDIEPGAA